MPTSFVNAPVIFDIDCSPPLSSPPLGCATTTLEAWPLLDIIAMWRNKLADEEVHSYSVMSPYLLKSSSSSLMLFLA
jgi:hypothetical protein